MLTVHSSSSFLTLHITIPSVLFDVTSLVFSTSKKLISLFQLFYSSCQINNKVLHVLLCKLKSSRHTARLHVCVIVIYTLSPLSNIVRVLSSISRRVLGDFDFCCKSCTSIEYLHLNTSSLSHIQQKYMYVL